MCFVNFCFWEVKASPNLFHSQLLLGTPDGVVRGVTQACQEAFRTLGPTHDFPRLGTIDLIPLHPITEATRLNDVLKKTNFVLNSM